MIDAPPPAFIVRLAEGDRTVGSLEDLAVMVAAGEVAGDALVSADGGVTWEAADAALSAGAPDDPNPWAAWDDADDDSVRKALEGYAGDPSDAFDDQPTDPGLQVSDAAELDPDSIQPLLDPIVARPRVPDLPAQAMSPIDTTGKHSLPPVARTATLREPPGGGKVIAFPGRERRAAPVHGSAALAPETPLSLHPSPPPLPMPTTAPPAPPSGTRWWRLGALAAVGAVVLFGIRGYVVGTAQTVYPPLQAPGGPSAGPDVPAQAQGAANTPPVPPEPAAERLPSSTPDGPYADLEREIRGQWLADPRDITGDNGLEDALYVELPRVHIDLVRARAPVTEWGGRKKAEPQAATFFVRYRSRPGEVERELAAITLVIGRYLSIYRLRSDQLTVERVKPGGAVRRLAIDPKQALDLYEQRLDLVTFLEGLAGG